MYFVKYGKIKNSYDDKTVLVIRKCGYENIPYIIYEKVDGANFSFITDGTDVITASRNQLVGGEFYNCQSVIDRYSEQIKQIKNEKFPDSKEIQVYGELYGDKIQKRVDYGTVTDFMVFDIRVDDEYIVPLEVEKIVVDFDIPYVPFMDQFDSLSKALEFDPEFDSMVPLEHKENNPAEGVVIRPRDINIVLPNGNRLILKKKSSKFSEKSKLRKSKSLLNDTLAQPS